MIVQLLTHPQLRLGLVWCSHLSGAKENGFFSDFWTYFSKTIIIDCVLSNELVNQSSTLKKELP